MSTYGKIEVRRFSGPPVSAVKMPRKSKDANCTYREVWMVWGGTMISSTTQANQNFLSGKLYRAKP